MEREYCNRRIELAKITSAPFGAGAFVKGNILIVGEQSSDPGSSLEPLPFCSVDGCSGWLNEMLDREKIQEDRLFWVNPFRQDGTKTDLKRLSEDLEPSYVIALGRVAKESCETAGIKFLQMHHPQYWKRFRSTERYPLLDLLKFLTNV